MAHIEIPDKAPEDGPYTFRRFPVPSDIPASLRVVKIVAVQRGSVLCQCEKVDREPQVAVESG